MFKEDCRSMLATFSSVLRFEGKRFFKYPSIWELYRGKNILGVTSGSNFGSTIDIKVRLDSDSPLAKAKVTSQRKVSEYTPDEECDRLELLNRLQEVTKTKERLESERVEMLDSLCKQVECNDALKLEIEDLKHNSRSSSRPGSAISKSESYSSLNSEKCANCANSGERLIIFPIIFILTTDLPFLLLIT